MLAIPTDKTNKNYRNDIQTLRAVSVIAVILNHLSNDLLPGGFLGVDIFFVISGYLISEKLLRENQETGHLKLLPFYAGRFRRLLPALSVVLVTSAIATSTILSPAEQVQHAQSGTFAALWLSNIFFISLDYQYFDSLRTSIFLHTWSLGVEEQFYVIWPLFILALLKIVEVKGLSFLKLSFILLFTSWILAIVSFQTDFYTGFYSLLGRSWQFLLGACACALTPQLLPINLKYDAIKRLSYTTLIACFYFGSAETPNLQLISSTLASICIAVLLIQQNSHPPSYYFLSPVLNFTGNISYSLYLWHWPVITLSKLYYIELGTTGNLITLGVTYVLASISYFTIEQPFRHSLTLKRKPILALTLAIATCISLAYCFEQWAQRATELSQTYEQEAIQINRHDLPTLYFEDCDDWYHSDELKICSFNKTGSATVTIFGDSSAGQWFDAVLKVAIEHNWKVQVITKSACPIVDASYFYPKLKRIYTECSSWRKKALEHLQSDPGDLIIISSADSYFKKNILIEGTRSILELLPTTANILLLGPTPPLSFDAIDCTARSEWQSSKSIRPQNCQQAIPPSNTAHYLEQSAKTFANVNVLDFSDNICPNNLCQAKNANGFIYRDNVHLSNQFAISLAEKFSPFFKKVSP